ncbi:MAG: hypothetical protein KAH09_04105, partial [Desulfobacula sp.]|nr:hypothetical protein [Desulfobacula sp.]
MGSSNWSMAELIFDSVTLKSLLSMVSSLLLLFIPTSLLLSFARVCVDPVQRGCVFVQTMLR